MDIEQERGTELIQTVVGLTGLPETAVEKELETMLSGMGVDPSQVTLDELRAALMNYLEGLQNEMM